MPSSHQEKLTRASAQSRKAILDSRASCDVTNAHTRSSHAAIDRSLELLKQPYAKGWGPIAE
jgi:hypothetical protein